MSAWLTMGAVAKIIRKRNNYTMLEAWQVSRVLDSMPDMQEIVQRAGKLRIVKEDDIPAIEQVLRDEGYLPSRGK